MWLQCKQRQICRHDQGRYRSDMEAAIKKLDHKVQALAKEKASHITATMWPGSLLSTAPTRQPRARTGQLCCIRRPNGVMDVAQLLIEHGADVTAQSKHGI